MSWRYDIDRTSIIETAQGERVYGLVHKAFGECNEQIRMLSQILNKQEKMTLTAI